MKYIRFIPALLLVSCTGTIEAPGIPEPEPAAEPEFQEPLLKFYDEHPDFILPVTRRNEIVTFVKGGLKDLSISRSTFDWGVPLPFDEGHVAYVWADALLAYATGIGYADPDRAEEFAARWPYKYHFVGKDITRFHCVIWPAMLMASDMPLPEHIFGHGFLLTKGEKMSKSKGNGVVPADLVKLFGVDAYRYYFMSDVQFGHDGSISMERMVQVYNNELANTWGNLVNRVFNMTKKYFGSIVPAVSAEHAGGPMLESNPLRDISDGLYAEFDRCMTEVDFTGAVAAVQKLAQAANLYVDEMAPWALAKTAKSEEASEQERTDAGAHYGLGLSIAQAVTKAHGGRIAAEYRKPRLIFTVTLPQKD